MKYDITYSCGHKGTIELFGKYKDRDRKIEWLEYKGLCPECYKHMKWEEEKKKGLILEVYLSVLDPEKPILLMFSGDSYSHKDEIKADGYFFGEEHPVTGLFDFFKMKPDPKRWWKTFSKEEAVDEMKKWHDRGAKIESHITAISLSLYRETMERKQKQDEAIAKLVKPERPAYLVGRWNGKIYGSRSKSIYLDGEKKELTDEEAQQLEKYQKDLETYQAEVKKIKEVK